MKSPLEQNYYELLEVPRDATLAEIDRAYDRARAYYGEGSVAVYTLASPEDLKRVQDRIDEAYLILADEKARAEYDARIGPPSPDERPLHKEVRQARERDVAKKEAAEKREGEKREEEKRAGEKREEEKREEEKREEEKREAEKKVEPAREEQRAEKAELAQKPEPLAAEAAKPALRASHAEGPLPPPSMQFPEPSPRTPVTPRPRPTEPEPERAAPRLEVPADAIFTGELLKKLREQLGLTVQEISDRTKIGRVHLDNIENDRFAALPAHVYLRGFLMSLARELRLDPLRVSKSYLDLAAAQKAKGGAKPRS